MGWSCRRNVGGHFNRTDDTENWEDRVPGKAQHTGRVPVKLLLGRRRVFVRSDRGDGAELDLKAAVVLDVSAR